MMLVCLLMYFPLPLFLFLEYLVLWVQVLVVFSFHQLIQPVPHTTVPHLVCTVHLCHHLIFFPTKCCKRYSLQCTLVSMVGSFFGIIFCKKDGTFFTYVIFAFRIGFSFLLILNSARGARQINFILGRCLYH